MATRAKPEIPVKATRRRLDPDQSREMILDATERLMRREGYGAVSSRRVAIEAGLKSPLVHYYYRTTDDLLLAFYQRSAMQSRAKLDAAAASPTPLWDIWRMTSDPERTALAAEFIALANHRKVIRAEITKNVLAARDLQVKVLEAALSRASSQGHSIDPTVAAVLMATIGYGLVLESQVGVTIGHARARRYIEDLIQSIESRPTDAGTQA